MRIRALLLLLLIPNLAAALSRADDQNATSETSRPKLVVDLVLEDSQIRPGSTSAVDLWITNASKIPVVDAELLMTSAHFLTLADGTNDCVHGLRTFEIGPVAANATLHRTLALCVGREVSELNTNLRVFLRYAWTTSDAGVTASAHQAVELPVRVRLLGVQLPGVPVGLAAVLIPGLLALMVLKLFGFPGVDRLDAGERGVIGVGISVLLAWLLALTWPPSGLDVMSPDRFVVLCFLAAVVALALILADRSLRRRKQRRRKARLVQPGDDAITALAKLLASEAGLVPGSVEVTDSEGTTWIGALHGERSDGAVVLLGWFEIRTDDVDLRAELSPMIDKGELSQALRRATTAKATVALRDGLRKRTADSEEETAENRQDFPLEPEPPTIQRAPPIRAGQLPLVLG